MKHRKKYKSSKKLKIYTDSWSFKKAFKKDYFDSDRFKKSKKILIRELTL